jgi:hypothetical protein
MLVVPAGARSIRNAVSLLELSRYVKLALPLEALAVRLPERQ